MKEIVIKTNGNTNEITVDGENISKNAFVFDFHFRAEVGKVTCEYGKNMRDSNGNLVIDETTNEIIKEYVKIF